MTLEQALKQFFCPCEGCYHDIQYGYNDCRVSSNDCKVYRAMKLIDSIEDPKSEAKKFIANYNFTKKPSF